MWPFRKNLEKKFAFLKKIKVDGFIFKIRKIDPLDYINGSQAVKAIYDTYKQQKKDVDPTQGHMNKVKAHYRDVLMGAVVEPKLCRKKEDNGIFVDNFFTDWKFAEKLYGEIMFLTYGKKKLRRLMSQNKN